jgi:hypothetical protein
VETTVETEENTMRSRIAAAAIVLAFMLSGCGKTSPTDIKPAGTGKGTKTAALEAAAGVVQRNTPPGELKIYLSGLHVMKNNPHHQMDAHHFCRQVNEDLAQCTIFDGNGRDANLVGIEYIISGKLFESLPPQEKRYWHPHNYEILSGQLVAPWIPDVAEKELMKGKMNSYGKTWHLWNTGMRGKKGNALPLGPPELAWSFNRDGEAMKGLLEKRDLEQKVDSAAKRKERADLATLTHPQQGVEAMKNDFPSAAPYPPGVREKR